MGFTVTFLNVILFEPVVMLFIFYKRINSQIHITIRIYQIVFCIKKRFFSLVF